MYNPVFFAYGLKTRTSTRPTTEINSALATSTPLTIAAILLSSRINAVIVNAMQSDIQHLQRQCRRCQGLAREWSPTTTTLDCHVHTAWFMQFHTAGS